MEKKMKDEMNLKTTINVEANRLQNLKQLCEVHGQSVSTVIKKAVKLYIDNLNMDEYKWCTITYQEKAPQFKKFHITLKPYEYDVYMDIKKITRFSFSLIVALAIDKYLDIILQQTDQIPDSYPLFAYSKYCTHKNNCTYLVFSWGISLTKVEITIPPEE
jgi:hypothetical protein